MTRPELTSTTPVEDFRGFYWLKEELLAFCRAHSLSTQGAKQALAERIAVFLASGERTAPPPAATPRRGTMPATLGRDTVIGAGWRCNEALRAFFLAEIGPHFHFDQVIRDYIKNGQGTTLQQAIDEWNKPRLQTVIAPQFEYNRFFRAFFETHPQATREEAINAWNEHKAQRRSETGTSD